MLKEVLAGMSAPDSSQLRKNLYEMCSLVSDDAGKSTCVAAPQRLTDSYTAIGLHASSYNSGLVIDLSLSEACPNVETSTAQLQTSASLYTPKYICNGCKWCTRHT